MKRYILSLFLAVIAYTMTGQENKVNSTFDAPDFNYPQTVITNAENTLNKAISTKNNDEIVVSLIQSSLAKSMISSDSLPSIIENIAQVRHNISNPCIKATLNLLEAHIINSYYTRNRYKIDSRNNMNQTDSSDIFAWDNNQFKQKISQLLDSALSYEKELKAIPITKYRSFITINDVSISTYPTMYDFIAYRSIAIYNSWSMSNSWNPFLKTNQKSHNSYENKIIDIYNKLLVQHPNGSRGYIKALLSKYDFKDENTLQRLDSLYTEYKENANSAPILLRLTQKTINKKEKYDLLKSYLEKFSDNDYSAQVKQNILSLEIPNGAISFNNQYTSIDSIKMECVISNVNKFRVSIFDISDKNYVRKKDFEETKPIYQTELSLNDTIPFSDTIAITVPPLKYGKYTAIIDIFDNNGKKIEQTNNYFSSFLVSDITSFSINNRAEKNRQIFAINAITGKAYKNVTIQSFTAGKDQQKFNQRTNSNGYITANNSKFYDFKFFKSDDKYYSAYIHKDNYMPDRNKYNNSIKIFTDLAIYRPGDTIKMAAVCYKVNSLRKEILSNEKVKVTFYDTNHDSISSVTLLSDEMGRIAHNFIVPTDRMNGNFSIEIRNPKTNEFFSHYNINVSDYKAPTFYVDFIDAKQSYSDSEEIRIKGIAKTFSGMPIADAIVKFSLETALWYSNYTPQSEYISSTDEMGNFSVSIDAKTLKQNMSSPFTSYKILATITNNTGETQTGSTVFRIGSAIALLWEHDSNKYLNIDASKKVKLPISITSTDNSINNIKCSLSLTSIKNEISDTLHFSSESPTLDFLHIKSGEYVINIWADDDTTTKIKNKKIVIFRPNDKHSPGNFALWTPYENLSCSPSEKSEILIGSAYNDCHFYYVINYEDEIIEQGWKHISKGMSKFRYTMPEHAESDLVIQFYCVRNLIPYVYNIYIKPEKKEPEAILTIESFRDKVTAGEEEKWTLHFSLNGKHAANSAIISTLTDAALNRLQNNNWIFTPKTNHISTSQALSIQNRYLWGGNMNRFNWKTKLDNIISELQKYPMITTPILNLYNQSFFAPNMKLSGRNMTMQYKIYSTDSDNGEKLGVMMDAAVLEESVNVSAQNTESALGIIQSVTSPNIENSLSDISLRTDEVKTVFWKPMLMTDENGNASIEFTVPNMNTTWMFQAVGYDKELNTATILKDIVSNKPIMVSPNMPRFLRQGDTATLMASIQNSTDSVKSGSASIELFNPINNALYRTETFDLSLAPNGTTPVSIEYTIPDTINAIGFRIKASDGKFSDGEQVMIPVLPSISPIIESTPFYINQGTNNYSINLPDYPSNATITFEYCDNPAWYITMALPSLKSGSATTASQLAHAIFANLTAGKLAENHPEIQDAITYWNEHSKDSVLVSMLEKNQELKIGTLLASPWLKESKEQTLRMSQLSELFNKNLSEPSTNRLIDKLAELQLDNGGFSWFKYPGAKASENITLSVLQLIGETKALGAISPTSKLNDIAVKAVNYIDKRIIDRYNNQKDKLSFSGYSDYAYTRSLFLDIPMSITVKNLYDKITQSLTKEWKSMNIADKAYTAITLANFDKVKAAKQILKSIKQFSIYKPTTGRFWDNFQSGWYTYCNKVTLTSLILQAYYKLEPLSKEIDQIRQWLLLEKQTSDWGNSSLAADAVYAILSTGSNWLQTNSSPVFTLNGNTFTMNQLDKILGYGKIRLDINNTTADNKINIKRSGQTPAWGAVYCQYSAPMDDVKATATSGLSITKKIIGYNNPEELKVGDKVQISLTIKNSRDLEFVTIADERAACFEPTEQLSEYRYEDGIGYYMEIKDSKTNMFFNHLPKGTHVITYDVYITNAGKFNSGVATIQCQYAPQNTAHSAGAIITVK